MANYLIIGGSSGIGKSLAEMLSEDNNVYATYNKTEVSHTKIQYIHYDVSGELMDAVLPDVLDGIAYCPGSINLKPFHRFSETDFIEDYKLQVIGAVKSIQKILPRLKKSEGGSIVLFSTVAVQTGFTFHSLVSSSKGAIEGLTKSLAAELSPKIRVNCIAPSITQTPLANSILSTDEKVLANAARHPLKKIGESSDVANMAKFLLTDSSKWITGQIIHVDGGMSSLKT